MSVVLKVPRLSVSMVEGLVQEWLVDDGATVREGEPIYVLEIDKVSQEIEAPASGVLRQRAIDGETYEVGYVIGEIESL